MPDPADERNPPAAEATPEAARADHAPVHQAPGHDPAPAEREAGPDEPEPAVASDLEPDGDAPQAAESPADLVRPYIARHHGPQVADGPVTDEVSAGDPLDDRFDDPIDDPSEGEVTTGRHGLDPSAFADTAEFPLFLLDGGDHDEPDPDPTAGLGRRTLLAVGVAVLAVLATLVGVALAAPRTPPVALEPTAPPTTVVEPTDASAGPVLPVPTTVVPSASPAATDRPTTTPAQTPVVPPPTTQPVPTATPTPPPTGPTGPITSLLSDNRCIDLQGDTASPGVAVQSFGCNGSSAQLWTVASDQSLQVHGLCLQPAGGSTAPGAGMIVATCNGSAAQHFEIQTMSTAGQRIRQGSAFGLCLSIPGDSLGDVQLVMDTCRKSDNGQRWATP